MVDWAVATGMKVIQLLPANDRTFILRNILNVIFIIGAIVGVIFYIYTDKLTGTFIIMFAMIVKFAESAIRFLHR